MNQSPGGIIRPVAYPAMDGLRFYAAFLVFMTHYIGLITTNILGGAVVGSGTSEGVGKLLAFIGNGNHGVDIFFVMSGFLMGRSVLGHKNRFSYPKFILARFLRIYPAFVVSYVAAVLCDLYFGWRWSAVDALAGLFLLNSIIPLGIIQYHYVSWSLGMEFIFYLIFPVLLLLPRRIPDAVKCGAAVLACVVLLKSVHELSWAFRITMLFIGLWVSCASDSTLSRFARTIPWPVALLPYFLFLGLLGSMWAFLILPVAITLLFVCVVYGRSPLSWLAERRMARFLGTISYSFYLWHTMCLSVTLFMILPALGLTAHGKLVTSLSLGVVALALSIAVSYASYLATERFYFVRRRAPERYQARPPEGSAKGHA